MHTGKIDAERKGYRFWTWIMSKSFSSSKRMICFLDLKLYIPEKNALAFFVRELPISDDDCRSQFILWLCEASTLAIVSMACSSPLNLP